MLYYVTSSAAYLFVPYLSQFSCKGQDFRYKTAFNSVLIFSTTVIKIFFISGRIQRDLLVNALMSLCKVQDTLLHFYTHFNKDAQNKIP